MRGATARAAQRLQRPVHFNPRSSCEERPPVFMDSSPIDADFNPRSSCEERLEQAALQSDSHISIHAPHARSDERAEICIIDDAIISIHAPHARSDIHLQQGFLSLANFNPRSSCEERHDSQIVEYGVIGFQSTLLMRGATHYHRSRTLLEHISIHAPHARSDS